MQALKIITIVFFVLCAFSLELLQMANATNSYYQYTIQNNDKVSASVSMGFKCFAVNVIAKDSGDTIESEDVTGGVLACRMGITAASFFFEFGIVIQSIAIFVFTIQLIVGTRSKTIFITMVVLSSVALLCTIISMFAILPISENYIKKSIYKDSGLIINFKWSKGISFYLLVVAVLLFLIPQIALAATALVLSCREAYQAVPGSGTFSNSNH